MYILHVLLQTVQCYKTHIFQRGQWNMQNISKIPVKYEFHNYSLQTTLLSFTIVRATRIIWHGLPNHEARLSKLCGIAAN